MAFDRALWCTPVGFSYLCDRHEGLFFMEENECVEMLACIALFKKLDPDVKIINTFAGATPDTVYVNTATGWKAFDPPRAGNAPQPKAPMVRH